MTTEENKKAIPPQNNVNVLSFERFFHQPKVSALAIIYGTLVGPNDCLLRPTKVFVASITSAPVGRAERLGVHVQVSSPEVDDCMSGNKTAKKATKERVR